MAKKWTPVFQSSASNSDGKSKKDTHAGFAWKHRQHESWSRCVTFHDSTLELNVAMAGSNLSDDDLIQWCVWFRDHLKWVAGSRRFWARDVNFSDNRLTEVGVANLLDTMANLKLDVVVLKLYKNQISSGKDIAAYLSNCNGSLHELHLSHNDLDNASALEIVVAAASARNARGAAVYPWRSEKGAACPLWLRLEHNYLKLEELNENLDVTLHELNTSRDAVLCEAANTNCTSRVCAAPRHRSDECGTPFPPAVHTPYLFKQREATTNKPTTSSRQTFAIGLPSARPKDYPTLLTKLPAAKKEQPPRVWVAKRATDQSRLEDQQNIASSATEGTPKASAAVTIGRLKGGIEQSSVQARKEVPPRVCVAKRTTDQSSLEAASATGENTKAAAVVGSEQRSVPTRKEAQPRVWVVKTAPDQSDQKNQGSAAASATMDSTGATAVGATERSSQGGEQNFAPFNSKSPDEKPVNCVPDRTISTHAYEKGFLLMVRELLQAQRILERNKDAGTKSNNDSEQSLGMKTAVCHSESFHGYVAGDCLDDASSSLAASVEHGDIAPLSTGRTVNVGEAPWLSRASAGKQADNAPPPLKDSKLNPNAKDFQPCGAFELPPEQAILRQAQAVSKLDRSVFFVSSDARRQLERERVRAYEAKQHAIEAGRAQLRQDQIQAQRAYVQHAYEVEHAHINAGRAHVQMLLADRSMLIEQIDQLEFRIQHAKAQLFPVGHQRQRDARQLTTQVSHHRARQLVLQRRLAELDQVLKPRAEQLLAAEIQADHQQAQRRRWEQLREEQIEEEHLIRLAREQHFLHQERMVTERRKQQKSQMRMIAKAKTGPKMQIGSKVKTGPPAHMVPWPVGVMEVPPAARSQID